MSEISLFHTTTLPFVPTKISVELLPNGHIHVDWRDLPKYRNVRQYVIHYKSLNTNESTALHLSRKEENAILQKIQLGHLYEIHVCAVDRTGRVLASSEHAQIQTKTLNQAPIFRVTKVTPDFIRLEWEKAEAVQLADIDSYKLTIGGQTIAILPSKENTFVVNEGEVGRKYIFQLEMKRKDGKTVSSIPISLTWPGVTKPEHHVFINGCEQLIICWGNSKSINDADIQSYTIHLYDSEQRLLTQIGPNPPERHQVWIKDVSIGIYYYKLETKLANSNKSIFSKLKKIECGRESIAPVLSYHYADSDDRERLTTMAFYLIKIRENLKSNSLQERCANQLEQILSTFSHLTDSLRLVLTVESKSDDQNSKSYRLVIDENESSMSMPGIVKTFPLELPRREKPYEISVLVTPNIYETKSNQILIEAADQFSFFCAHFNQHPSMTSCSYLQTLSYEKEENRLFHQGLLKVPQEMKKIQVYDLKEDRIVQFPSNSKGHRFSIVFFYLIRCVSSMEHSKYFSTYALAYPTQYNYILINCDRSDPDKLKELTKGFHHIQCYTDFSPEEFEYEQKGNDQSIDQLLSLDGVPTYFILNFPGRVVWKGRLSAQGQPEYHQAMDHIIAESQQQRCSLSSCELCSCRSMDNAQIQSALDLAAENLQAIVQRQSTQLEIQTRRQNQDRARTVFSMKQISEYK